MIFGRQRPVTARGESFLSGCPYWWALLFISMAVFLPVCRNGFIAGYDDEIYLTINRVVSQGLTLDGIRWAFTTFTGGNWHPLTWLSHMLDVTLFGLAPAPHHLVSVVIHSVSALLLYRLLSRSGLGVWSAWLAALLFAVHPQRVESVAWAAERKDVLSVFFGLAALNTYLSYYARRTPGRYLAMAGLYLLSLLSKSMLVTLPLLMLALDHFVLRRPAKELRRVALAEKIPLLLIALLIGAVTWHAQTGSNAVVAAPLLERLTTTLASYAQYLRLFFFPFGLSFHYALDSAQIGTLLPLTGFLVIGGGVWLIMQQRSPLPAFGCFWFFLTLLPVSGIVRFGGQFVADRYTYFPHIGLIIVLAWGGERLLGIWPALKPLGAFAMTCLLSGLIFLTVLQISYWHDGERLYRRAIELNPDNWLAYGNLGAVLLQQDRYGEGFLLLARSQLLQGRPVEAEETLRSARRVGGVLQAELDELQRKITDRLR